MINISIALKILDSGDNLPVGFSELSVHMVFDIKLDLTRKARIVADVHLTPDPIDSTYARVVSKESARIALTYAVLLGVDIWVANIVNDFGQTPTAE